MPQFDKDRYFNGGNYYISDFGWAMHEGALVDYSRSLICGIHIDPFNNFMLK